MRAGWMVCWLTGVLATSLSSVRGADDKADFFEKKVRPILVEHCYSCHSTSTKSKGDLVLDFRQGLLKGGESGPAVVPGKPEESLLITALQYGTDFPKMPPKGKLPPQVIADLTRWIAEGAFDPREKPASDTVGTKKVAGSSAYIEEGRKFWAYQPPRQHPLPAVKDQAWAKSDIDRFVLAKLEEKGLKPAPRADRLTLLRRVHFDLTGLPPSPAEIEAFLNDTAPDPFARVVDKLLASPHYGERWGRHWLDVARFAESSGGGRSLLFPDAWRYRDYVIQSFNDDLPYPQFITEQIAGDLLPSSTPEQRHRQLVAVAFLALGPTNYEGQDKDVLEMDVIDEQLDTTGRVFLGMTIGCARCHDHKFDPIPTKDYYALAGIMKSTQTLIHDNVSRWVDQPLPVSPAQQVRIQQHEQSVAALKEQIKLAKQAEARAGAVTSTSDAGKNAASTTPGKSAKPGTKPIKVSDLPGIVVDDSQAKQVGTWTHSTYSGNYIGDGYLHDNNAEKGEKTLTFVPPITRAGRYEIRLAYVPGTTRAERVPVTILHQDGEYNGFINFKETPPIDGRFISLGTYRLGTNGQWFVMISNENTKGHVTVDAVQFLPEEDDAGTAAKPAATKTSLAKTDAGKSDAATKPEANKPDAAKPDANKPDATRPDAGQAAARVKELEAELKRLMEKAPTRPLAMAVKEAAKIEDCSVLIRGVLTNKGPQVPRGFLQVLSPPPSAELPLTLPEKESGRRELAAWLARADNPLTARVMVNRIWHHLLGAGIVRTVDLFGTTGELPSHPELLDHLALKFVEQGWSTKKLIREIVLSQTYQMSSDVPSLPAGSAGGSHPLLVDPENRLLWHMNRRRLEAEALRDTLLVTSGKLDRTMGGPIAVPQGGEYGYKFTDTRRSVYTPVLRNRQHEMFEVFDFADPNLSLGSRTSSTVASQALYMLNSPFVTEQAHAAAESLLAVTDLTDEQRLDRLYLTALTRPPTPRERELSLHYLAGKNRPQDRLAAWQQICHTLVASLDFRYVK